MRLSKIITSVLTALVWTQSAYSFTPPPNTNAGVIERQIENEYEDKEVTPTREVPLIEIDIPEERFEMADDATVFIEKIKVEGNDVLSKKMVRKVIAPYEQRDLTMSDIKAVCLKLQEVFIKEGYFLARCFPPPQEIKDGVLVIEVIEGKLGEVTIEGNKYYKTDYIMKFFSKFQGKAINYDALLKSLFLLNENTDLNIGAIFKKGKEMGTADLILRVDDSRPCHLSIDENNYGAHQTTIWRTGGRFEYGNLFTGGDMLTLTEVIGNPASRINYTNASYTIPVNTIGTAIKMNYLYSNFHVDQFKDLRLRGRTQIGTVEVTQALSRTRGISTNIYLSFDFKQIRNYQQGLTSSYDKLRVFTLGFDLDCMDRWKGRNVADFYLTYGVPHFLGGLKTVDDQASRTGSGGLFAVLNADYTRVQTITNSVFATFHFSGQVTPYKLPISQQIYVGGVDTVRGFPMSAALGDDGYYANLELRASPPLIKDKKVPLMRGKTWGQFLQFVGFVDQGGVLLNGGGENQSQHISMTGAGVGLRLFAKYLNVSFDVAFPLTGEKKQSSPVYYFKAGLQPF